MKASTRHRKFAREASAELYDKLLELQGGHCALCPNKPRTRRLNLDHDHRTMEVRGLLCGSCNQALPDGKSPEWIRRAADYIEGSWRRP